MRWILWIVLCAVASAQAGHYRHHGDYLLPDPQLTPGTVNPEIEADTSRDRRLLDGVEVNICAPDFRSKPLRRTTEAMKRAVCREYGSPLDCPDPKKGEIDHLIPLEIGGQDAIANLWWQTSSQYVKDRQVEDKLPKLICDGKISLQDAQRCVSSDWVACLERIRGL